MRKHASFWLCCMCFAMKPSARNFVYQEIRANEIAFLKVATGITIDLIFLGSKSLSVLGLLEPCGSLRPFSQQSPACSSLEKPHYGQWNKEQIISYYLHLWDIIIDFASQSFLWWIFIGKHTKPLKDNRIITLRAIQEERKTIWIIYLSIKKLLIRFWARDFYGVKVDEAEKFIN